MKKFICLLLSHLYVFIIPIYYQHCKESAIRRGLQWDNNAQTNCYIMSITWPICICVEGYLWTEKAIKTVDIYKD